jgi:hypothetical protein
LADVAAYLIVGGGVVTEQEFNAVVIDRLARIETGIVALNDKIDKLTDASGKHEDTLSNHEARLLLIESRKGGWKVGISITAGLVAVAAFILTVLDRIYLK